MLQSHIAPTTFALLLWISTGRCQYDPYGGSPYYGEPDPYGQFAGAPPQQPPQQYYPPNPNNANLNPFLPAAGQAQAQSTQQQLQGYPNLPQIPFQTVTQNPLQRVDRYPFQPQQTLGNLGASSGINNNQIQQQTFGNSFLNPNTQEYPKIPDFPFQTVQPGGGANSQNPNVLAYPRTQLPKIRVIEYPSSDYFEYGGGKLVTPKRPNSDLYVGGVGGDVPITSKIFIECTGPNQVEWVFNGTEKKDLSVVTKNFQITIPEQRDPTPGSGEYTYLRLGLEKQIEEKDTGVYMCRDRILPQNYITIRVIVAKPITGKPNYPFIRPRDPNTIYYSRRQANVVLPCKIENADATISLHKHDGGKLSCPYPLDGRVSYDRFRGFILNTQAFKDLDGRYVCVGDFNGELRLMKYTLIASEDFTNRYVEGEAQNIIALDSEKKSAASSSLLAQGDTLSNTFLSGLNIQNLTAAGFIDPRAEFETGIADLFALEDESTTNKPNSTTTNNKPPPPPVSTKSAKKP